MGRWTASLILLLSTLLLPLSGLATINPTQEAVLDSLAAWHHASLPARVDSLASLEIPRARDTGQDDYLRQLQLHLGRTLSAFGMARQAEPHLQKACLMAAAAADTGTWLMSLRWLGVAVGRQGRAAEAADNYRLLGELAAAVGDSLHLGWSRLGLAYDHYLAGRTDQAITAYGLAAGMLDRAGVKKGAIWAWNGQGLALRQAGRYSAAEAGFRHALHLARASGDALNEAMALNYLGRLELQFGDPGRAVPLLAQAAAIHQEFNHNREGLLPLLDLAKAHELQGRHGLALRQLALVLERSRQHGLEDLEIKALGHMAEIRMAQGRPGKSAALCREALDRPTMPSVMADTEIRLGLSRALAARDSLGAALAVLEPVSGTACAGTLLQLQVVLQQGRLLLDQGRFAAVLAKCLPAVDQARAVGANGLPTPLMATAGRALFGQGRETAALDMMGKAIRQWEQVRRIPGEAAWRELRSAAAGEVFTQAAVMLLTGEEIRDPARAFDLVQGYKGRTLRERLTGPGRHLDPEQVHMTLARLQEEILGPGEVFLDVLEDGDITVLFCVTTTSLEVAVLPGARARTKVVRHLLEVLDSRAIVAAGPALALAGSLVAAWPRAVQIMLQNSRRIFWCPDGSWHRVPMALLGGTGSCGLIPDSGEVCRVPASSFLKPRQQRLWKEGNNPTVLAVSGHGDSVADTLPGAVLEIAWLQRHFHHVHTAGSSGPDAFDPVLWQTAGIIHVTGHTSTNAQQPWQTSLALGRSNILRAADVAGLTLEARLTVLASCQTVGSRILMGEGPIGLAAAFLVAGSPAVVATLWPVDDDVTARFMGWFYTALSRGSSVSSSLNQARDHCRREPLMSAPRHWAGFILIGDGGVTVPVESRRPRWFLLGGGLAIAVGLVWRGKKVGGTH